MSIAKPARKTATPTRAPIQLAVVGGGPKAAAIAAKAWVLREQGQADVQVTVFESEHIGANWSGRAGYTDGEQRLCTIAERDVGYPYIREFGAEVDIAMSAHFSWSRFLHEQPDGYGMGYSSWVDAGRKPPLHKHFADYLAWVVARAAPQAQVVNRRVTRLAAEGGKWRIESAGKRGGRWTHAARFDAAVVTGPGPARTIPVAKPAAVAFPKNIFNGKDFWQRLDQVRACLKAAAEVGDFGENTIVIVGAGGTAAAILAWLVTNGAADMPIQMVASQASLHTRVDSVFENRLFTDDAQWRTLSPKSRRAFFDRLNRGVVWATVVDRVSAASSFTMIDGRAQKVVVTGAGEVQLEALRGDGEPITLRASMLVDCSGFDAWWFLPLVAGLPAGRPEDEGTRRETWQQGMADNLQLQGAPWNGYPALHAPMLSSELGPGFGSLMVLGAMADRILRPYWSLARGPAPA